MSRYPGLDPPSYHSRPSTSPYVGIYKSDMSTSPTVVQGIFDPPPNVLPNSEAAYPSSPLPTLYPQLILFGDSITQFGSLTLQPYLQTQYIRRLDVINRGFSGFTAPMGLSILPKLFPGQQQLPGSPSEPQIKIMTVFFGANDAALPPSAQHVALSQYIEALSQIVQYPTFQLPSHLTKFIIITPPPVNEHQLSPDNTRRACSAAAYALAARQLGQSLQLPCIDLWTIFMTKAGWKEDMGRDCCRHKHPEQHLNSNSHQQGDLNPRLNSENSGAHSQGHLSSILAESDMPNITAQRHIPGCIHAPPNPVLPNLLSDGLHITKQGYDILFWSLMDIIRTHIPDCAPENLPYVLVEWRNALGVNGS